MSIGNRIKDTRINRGLTQEEIAKFVGVAPQTIYKYEKEIVTNIPLERLTKIAKFLNTSVAYLLGDIDDPDDKSWWISAIDLAFDEMADNDTWQKAVKHAEKEHLRALYSICKGDGNYKSATELYNRDFLPTRINMVTEFILSNKEFLQRNMPGIEIIKDKDQKADTKD